MALCSLPPPTPWTCLLQNYHHISTRWVCARVGKGRRQPSYWKPHKLPTEIEREGGTQKTLGFLPTAWAHRGLKVPSRQEKGLKVFAETNNGSRVSRNAQKSFSNCPSHRLSKPRPILALICLHMFYSLGHMVPWQGLWRPKGSYFGMHSKSLLLSQVNLFMELFLFIHFCKDNMWPNGGRGSSLGSLGNRNRYLQMVSGLWYSKLLTLMT